MEEIKDTAEENPDGGDGPLGELSNRTTKL